MKKILMILSLFSMCAFMGCSYDKACSVDGENDGTGMAIHKDALQTPDSDYDDEDFDD